MAKSAQAFRSISEAADEVGAPQHVLRFWETKFNFLQPVKRAGGRRFYRPQDIVVLKAIKRLLHEQGLTIRGVQRLHKEQGIARLAAYGDPDGATAFETAGEGSPDAAPAQAPIQTPAAQTASGPSINPARLRQTLADLEGARARLDAVLSRSA